MTAAHYAACLGAIIVLALVAALDPTTAIVAAQIGGM